MAKRKKTRRQRSKYPALDPKLNRKNLRDLIDFDYLEQLSPADLEFLNKYTKEAYSADFTGDKPLYTGKRKRRAIYKENNSRNQDTTSYLGSFGKLESYEGLNDDDLQARSPEDSLIAMIDLKRKKT